MKKPWRTAAVLAASLALTVPGTAYADDYVNEGPGVALDQSMEQSSPGVILNDSNSNVTGGPGAATCIREAYGNACKAQPMRYG